MKIGIQGTVGSFHYEVAKNLFGTENEFIECMDFNDIPVLLKQGKIDKGVMAIENTIAGAILPNYALIDEYDLHIAGEYYLPIQHHLMALHGQSVADIKEVWSHPMALLQCRRYLRSQPHIKLVEEKDTAEMAKIIQERQLKGIAAIAGYEAARIYDLDILAENIQTNQINATRFVVLDLDNGDSQKAFNKSSIRFKLSHRPGSLVEILQIFKHYKLNMSKIQSVPIIDKPWEYAFFADLLIDNLPDYRSAMYEVARQVTELKILGEYISRQSQVLPKELNETKSSQTQHQG